MKRKRQVHHTDDTTKSAISDASSLEKKRKASEAVESGDDDCYLYSEDLLRETLAASENLPSNYVVTPSEIIDEASADTELPNEEEEAELTAQFQHIECGEMMARDTIDEQLRVSDEVTCEHCREDMRAQWNVLTTKESLDYKIALQWLKKAIRHGSAKKDNEKHSTYFALKQLLTREDMTAALQYTDYDAAMSLVSYVVHYGDEYALKILLNKGANPNMPSRCAQPPLHDAVRLSKPWAVKLLLEHGVEVDAFSDRQLTAQQLSINKLNYHLSRSVCYDESLSKVRQKGGVTSCSATLFASEQKNEVAGEVVEGNFNTLKNIIQSFDPPADKCEQLRDAVEEIGVDMGKRLAYHVDSEEGYTLAHYCVFKREVRLLEVLAKYNYSLDTKDDAGRKPLFYAVKKGYALIIAFLLDHTEDEVSKDLIRLVNEKSEKHHVIVELQHVIMSLFANAKRHDVNVNINHLPRGFDGRTPFMNACMNGDERFVRAELTKASNKEININQVDSNNLTALMLAISRYGLSDAMISVEYILESYAPLFNTGSFNRWIDYLILHGYIDDVRIPHLAGWRLSDRFHEVFNHKEKILTLGETTLDMQFVMTIRENIIRMLIENGARLDIRDNYGRSAYELALSSVSSVANFSYLLKYDLMHNAFFDDCKKDILHFAYSSDSQYDPCRVIKIYRNVAQRDDDLLQMLLVEFFDERMDFEVFSYILEALKLNDQLLQRDEYGRFPVNVYEQDSRVSETVREHLGVKTLEVIGKYREANGTVDYDIEELENSLCQPNVSERDWQYYDEVFGTSDDESEHTPLAMGFRF